MLPNLKPSQNIAVVDSIAPQSLAAGSVSTSWINAGLYRHIAALVELGTPGSGGLLDAKLQQATDSSGANAKDLQTMTQMSAAGTTIIQAPSSALDLANSFDWVRLTITTSVATSPVAAQLLGLDERYGDASNNNKANVAVAG